VNEISDVPQGLVRQIEHFFSHYKDLEPGKWARLHGWGGRDQAERLILEAIERAKGKQTVTGN